MKLRIHLRLVLAGVLVASALGAHAAPATGGSPRKIVLIAGPITGHPKDAHEYEKSVVLLKHLLDTSPSLEGRVKVEAHFKGWPADPRTLDDADTIVLIGDGGDHREQDHPLYVGDRLAQFRRQMQRGCGVVFYHWTTFHPARLHDEITTWAGGYFDYETGNTPNHWYSAIQTWTADAKPVAGHPITRGMKPWSAPEEFYYRLKFRGADPASAAVGGAMVDPRLSPILTTRPPKETNEFTVAWAVERADGGRGFGTTGGHFYAQWWLADWRRMILNAIAWTAKLDVPAAGIESVPMERFKALIVTGANHPAHDWNATTAALLLALEQDPRAIVHVAEDPEELAKPGRLDGYDLVVWNYVNWERPGLSEAAKQAFLAYLRRGGGLSFVHFGASAFHPSLQKTRPEDAWPEFYEKIARRVWEHRPPSPSGHDAFAPFHVAITAAAHPITAGLASFDTQDELYFNQAGSAPIEPLATAFSKITKRDEPLAWAYSYERARVFQTVLGHSDVSVRKAAALIRRGSVWAAGKAPLSFDPPPELTEGALFRDPSPWKPHAAGAPVSDPARPASPQKRAALESGTPASRLVEGRFGKALNAAAAGVVFPRQLRGMAPPLTIECWAKLRRADNFNILIAAEPKSSPTHWELYTYAGSGELSFYVPGRAPAEIRSGVNVCDNRWHHLAAQFEANRVALLVDGRRVKEQAIKADDLPPVAERLDVGIGMLAESGLGCDGLVDDVRVSRGVREIKAAPDGPAAKDATTVALWRFDTGEELATARGFQVAASGGASAVSSDGPKTAARNPGEPAASGREAGTQGEKDWVDNRWQQTDVGPFLASILPTPNGTIAKALSVKVGENGEGAVAYDLATCSFRAAWTGGFLKFSPARFGLIEPPAIGGEVVFSAPAKRDPASASRFLGLHLQGKRVVLEYEAGGCRVRETPWLEVSDGVRVFSRTFELGPGNSGGEVVRVRLQRPNGSTAAIQGPAVGYSLGGRSIMASLQKAGVDGALAGVAVNDGWEWEMRPGIAANRYTFLVTVGESTALASFERVRRQILSVGSTNLEVRPGPARWPALTTHGQRGLDTDFLAVDTLTMPYDNPWKALLFGSGVDFTADGAAYVCTIHGDVWRVTGIDDSLGELKWKRFATGLFQPLGLKVRDGQVFVLGRDRITRLHDENGDGEADFYENFFDGIETSTGGHDYVTCLEKDDAGNFYYVDPKGVYRVAADGKSKTRLGTGWRNPNGLGVSPDGRILTVSPQQGNWTPSSVITEVRLGGYYGYGGPKITPERPLGYDPHLCWIPHGVDNSSGSQVWVPRLERGAPSGALGAPVPRWDSSPFAGQLLHLLWGRCSMMMALRDEVGGGGLDRGAEAAVNGAVVPLPVKLLSGPNRGSFNPRDGQLYVAGSTGWQTSALKDGALQRIRFTGRSVFLPVAWHAHANGISITFSQPLARAEAEDIGSYALKQWNYRYAAEYGSKDWSVANPSKEGRDEVPVKSAHLSTDGRTVFLEMPGLQPVMQIEVKYNLASASGGGSKRGEFWLTVNRTGEPYR